MSHTFRRALYRLYHFCKWVIIGALAICPVLQSWAEAHSKDFRVVGYLASWEPFQQAFPDEARADELSHVIYAFANISPKGEVVLGDPCNDAGQCQGDSNETSHFKQLQSLKTRHPDLKVLIAIGGWDGSEQFSDVVRTEESRTRFVRSAVELFLDGWPKLFDGFDLDWEYPVEGGKPGNVTRPEDKQNYATLIEDFRRELDFRARKYQRKFLLSVAVPASMEAMQNIEIDKIQRHVDWFNLMTYDYHTGEGFAHFNAPLHAAAGDATPLSNVDSSVTAYLTTGVPSEKLVLGIPFFGYVCRGVMPGASFGLFQASDAEEAGRFKDLKRFAQKYPRHWSAAAAEPWFYDPEDRKWISYDDSESITAKTKYALTRRLGGVMVWELSGDDGTLLKTIKQQVEVNSNSPAPIKGDPQTP